VNRNASAQNRAIHRHWADYAAVGLFAQTFTEPRQNAGCVLRALATGSTACRTLGGTDEPKPGNATSHPGPARRADEWRLSV